MKILENPTDSELKEIKHVFDNGFFTLDNGTSPKVNFNFPILMDKR